MKQTLVILLSIIALSCDKNELTPINGDGSGGISCILDGTILNPSGGGIYGNTTCRFDYIPDEQVYIFIVGFSSRQFDFSSVSVVLYDVDLDNFDGQTFDLVGTDTVNNEESFGRVTVGSFDVEGRNYHTSSLRTGTLTILHYDEEDRTVSGLFEFEAENELGEVILISDGRFDKRV